MPRDNTVLFETVRLKALDRLWRGMFTRSGYLRPCVWQDYVEAQHSAVYCNVISHLETLADLLREGQWCDHIDLPRRFSERAEHSRLFRYYGLAFLAMEQCIQDLRLIRGAMRGRSSTEKVEPNAEAYVGFINGVWKHRNRDEQFHRLHHHGPYLFADRPWAVMSVPRSGRYLALGHRPPGDLVPPVPLVVPSLVDGMGALAEVLRRTSGMLRNDPALRQQVESTYGTVMLP